MIGQTLGHYQIVDEIGSGGMGVVYKARDLHLDRFVALKILPAERLTDPDRKARFVREAKAASALNHSNIIHVYDIASDAGIDFIAMEYVEGKTLDQLIGRRGLPLKDTLRYAIQISDALAKAHSAGIVHRDLKPSNIMVNEEGTAKLLDFGLAKLTEQVQPNELISTATVSPLENQLLTEKGIVVGTVAYMSPEQAEGKVVDPRSDIFSFGSVLYEMITGRKSFQGSNKFSTISAILEKEPAPLSAEVPHDLERVVARCLRKDPARRFQNMADLKVALEELKEESDSQNRTADSIHARGRARSTGVWAGLAVMLTAAAAIIAWYYLRPVLKNELSSASGAAAGGKLRLLVSSAGEAFEPAISPDGKMLAFVAEAGGRFDLYVRRVAGGERIRLTDDDAQESSPGFSPDGERIQYTRAGSGKSEIWTVPALGGQPTRLIENALEAAWSLDGKRLAFVLRRPGEGDALAISGENGSDIKIIMRSDGTYPFIQTPSWSPDGTQLAATRSTGGAAGELWLAPLDGKPPQRLCADGPGVFSNTPVFTPDGRGLVHVSNRGGASNLWILPLYGGQPIRLTSGPGPDMAPSVARDGSIVFANTRSRSALILYNLAAGKTRDFLSHSWYIWAPVFSPSGRELAFSRAEQDGSWHIWIAPLEGGAARQLTSGSLPEIYPRFTPDGASVVYQTWSSGPDRIWSVPRAGGPPTPLTPARDDDDQYADISPDGQWLAFARTENKITRIYVAPLKGGEVKRLTESPSTLPRWSPDGKWIAFTPSRGYVDGIFVMKPDGTGVRKVSEAGGWPVWWPDSSQLGFENIGKDGFVEFCAISLTSGAVRSVTSLQFTSSNHPFDISPDSQMLATGTSQVLASDIWLLESGKK